MATRDARGSAATARATAIRLRPWLNHLRAQLPGVYAGRDPEALHQLRAAVARIRVWLQLAGYKELDDELRRVRHATALVRDLDVQLTGKLPPAYAAELRSERARARRELCRMLRARRVATLLQSLERLPGVPRAEAEQQLRKLARRALRRDRSRKSTKHERIHATRRRVRRLRFALEWLGRSAEPLAALQHDLGAYNDAWVALRRCRRSASRRALRGHRRALKRDLRSAADDARRAWKRARPYLQTLV